MTTDRQNRDVVEMQVIDAIQKFGLALARQLRDKAMRLDHTTRALPDSDYGRARKHDILLTSTAIMEVSVIVLDALKEWKNEYKEVKT